MKRLVNYLLVAVLCLSLVSGACLVHSSEIVYANNSSITSTGKTLKESIYSSLANFEKEFSFEYEGDIGSLKEQLNTAMNDIRMSDSYVFENMSKWEVSYSYIGKKATINFVITYLTTKEQEDYVAAQVKKILPNIVSATALDFDKVKAVHDYIILNASYSKETKNSQYVTYTLLTEKQGVCQAYALLMYKMLEELNVDVKYVKGEAGDMRHAWILAKVEGEWFHIDPTWNDPVGNQADEVRYKYFLLSDKQIAATHTWKMNEYPVATSEKYKHLHVARNAHTSANKLYYRNVKDKKTYQMDLKTFKSTSMTAAEYKKAKLILLRIAK